MSFRRFAQPQLGGLGTNVGALVVKGLGGAALLPMLADIRKTQGFRSQQRRVAWKLLRVTPPKAKGF
jgi:hypothetical protein